MNKKTIHTFLLLIFYSFSVINGMQNNILLTSFAASTAIAYSLLIKSKQSKDEPKNFWVKTKDGHIIGLTDDIVQNCLKLHLFKKYYNQNNPLPVCFTSNEINIFLDALQNPTTIDYDKNINLIMNIAEKFGVYTLYAWCVSNYLSYTGAQDIDKNKIVPFLKKLTDNDESDFILSKMVSLKNLHFIEQDIDISDIPFVESKDYYLVNANDLGSTYIIVEEYIIFNKNKKEVYRFRSKFSPKKKLTKPYLFKEKNIILFHRDESNVNRPILLYDFINKKKLASFSGQNFNITSNEKYIGIISSNDSKSLDLYNIENIHNIKCKKLNIKEKYFLNFIFSFDANHLVAILKDNDDNLMFNVIHWNLSDFDWNNEYYSPVYTILKKATQLYCGIKFCENNNLLIKGDKIKDGNIINYLYKINIINENYNNYIEEGSFFSIDCHNNNLIIQSNKNKKTNSTIKIYHINDLSHCLYQYEGEFKYINCRNNSSYLGIDLYTSKHLNSWYKSLLLKYDSIKNSIIESIHTIEGKINKINERGWFLTSSNYASNYSTDIFLYDNKGKKVLELNEDETRFGVELSSEGHNLRVFKDYYKMNLLDKVYYLYKNTIILDQLFFKASLYTQKEFETCNTLYNDINCQQYAFCDTICSENSKIFLQDNPLLKNMLDSFQQKDKNSLEDKLKIEY